MAYLAAGVLALGLLVMMGKVIANADTAALARQIRYSLGGLLVVAGLIFFLLRRLDIGIILIAAGVSAIATGRIGPIDLGGSRRSAGTASKVRSRVLEMVLDHDSGALSGRVLKGPFAGRKLDGLDRDALARLYRSLGADRDSAALLEAYLDRRFAGWREDVQFDRAAGAGGAPNAGPMTDEEAYQILGLLPGATEAEIRAAHRRLMKGVHPDQGGSTFLAAKINQAKDRLLSKHR
jgi:hypothetical protein